MEGILYILRSHANPDKKKIPPTIFLIIIYTLLIDQNSAKTYVKFCNINHIPDILKMVTWKQTYS